MYIEYENVMDELFGEDNFVSDIVFRKTSGQSSKFLSGTMITLFGMQKSKKSNAKYRPLFGVLGEDVGDDAYNCVESDDGEWRRLKKNESIPASLKRFRTADITSQGASEIGSAPFEYQGMTYSPSKGNHWKPSGAGLKRLAKTARFSGGWEKTYLQKDSFDGFSCSYLPSHNIWMDTILKVRLQ